MQKISLTGIQPSGVPHLGNYLGAIRPGLELARSHRTIYFIADYHALTHVRDPDLLRQSVHSVAATWLACGLDPEETVLFRQSDVPEVFELAWTIACVLATGQLERGHSYKDALSRGEAPNAGLFFYPVLMAADILLYDADVVPVGQDQRQHLELTRDAATRLNHLFGEGTVVVPEALISDAPLVPGTDGRKMSKSHGNAIPLFAPPKQLRKVIMGIKTGSESLEEPKDPDGSTVFELYRLVADSVQLRELEQKLRAGGYGWGHAKEDLFQALESDIAPMRARYEALCAAPGELDEILLRGAERARVMARATLARVRQAVGIDR